MSGLAPVVRQQAFKLGVSAPGAKLITQLSGTSTPHSVFLNAALSTAAANPLVADSSGRFATFWLDDRIYRMTLTDSADATIWGPIDGITTSGGGGGGGTTDSVFNVKNYGAVGDGTTDDTVDIQAAITAATSAGGGTVFFPTGSYLISRNGANAYCLLGASLVNMKGEGPSSKLLLANNTPNSVRMLSYSQQHDVEVSALEFDGRYASQTGTIDQQHALFVDDCEHVIVHRVTMTNTGGDGILVMGATGDCDDVEVSSCAFDGNRRNGITLYNGYWGVKILNNTFGPDIQFQAIDSEPDAGTNGNVICIGNCTSIQSANPYDAIEVGGVSNANPTVGWLITGNDFQGSVRLTWSSHVTLVGNTVLGSLDSAVHCDTSNVDFTISANVIEAPGMPGVNIVSTLGDFPARGNVTGNKIHVTGAFQGIISRGADDINMTGNTIVGDGTGGSMGIYIFPAARDMENQVVVGNIIKNVFLGFVCDNGIGSNTVTRVTLVGNVFEATFNAVIIDTTSTFNLVEIGNSPDTGGGWTEVTFSAGNFTAKGAMTWTVASGDVQTFVWTKVGKTMTVAVSLAATTVAGTPDDELYILIPGSFTSVRTITSSCPLLGDNGVFETGSLTVSGGGGTQIIVRRGNLANFTASSNNTLIAGTITFETTT